MLRPGSIGQTVATSDWTAPETAETWEVAPGVLLGLDEVGRG
jgi:hypothetical protein